MWTQKFHTMRYALKKCISKRHGWVWKPWTLPGTCFSEARMLVLPYGIPSNYKHRVWKSGGRQSMELSGSCKPLSKAGDPQQGWSPGFMGERTMKLEILTKDSLWCIFSTLLRDLDLTLKITSSLGRKLSSSDPLTPVHSILSEIMGFQHGALCAHDTEGRWCIHLRIKPCPQLPAPNPLAVALTWKK